MSRHDWRNYQTCMCGEPGCGSYRPFPDGPTSREMWTPYNVDRIAEAICGTTSAGKLFPWAESTEKDREPWRRMARAAVEAMHPVVETVEQLDALPVGTVALDDLGHVGRLHTPFGGWHMLGYLGQHRPVLPARVLYTPEADR